MENEEFEDFEEAEAETEPKEELAPKAMPMPVAARKVGRPPKIEAKAEPRVEAEIEEPKYIAIPKAVSEAEMLNIIYEGQQEIKQALGAIFEKIK